MPFVAKTYICMYNCRTNTSYTCIMCIIYISKYSELDRRHTYFVHHYTIFSGPRKKNVLGLYLPSYNTYIYTVPMYCLVQSRTICIQVYTNIMVYIQRVFRSNIFVRSVAPRKVFFSITKNKITLLFNSSTNGNKDHYPNIYLQRTNIYTHTHTHIYL